MTFVFVGGGYAGVEAMAELEDMARYATRYYDDIEPRDMRWVLVEAATRIMPEVSVATGAYTAERLAERGIDVRLDTRLNSVDGGHVVLSDGDEFDAETLVWTAGVKANPMLDRDRPAAATTRAALPCDAEPARSAASTGVSRPGDCAAVPDLSRRTTRPR